MSIVRRIFLGFLILAVLFLIFAVGYGLTVTFVYNDLRETQARANKLDREAQALQQKAAAIGTQFSLEAAGVRQPESSRVDYATQVKEASTTIDDIERDAWDDESRALAKKLRVQLDNFAAGAENIDKLRKSGTSPEAMQNMFVLAVGIADQAQETANAIVAHSQEAADAKVAAAGRRADRVESFMLVGFTVATVFALLLAFLLPRSISRRLRSVTIDLATSAREMLTVATQVAAGAMETATAVSEAATTIDEVRQTSLLASQKATAVADSARSADQVAEAGREATGRATERMDRIRDQMGSLAVTVADLTARAQAAGEVVTTINDLAEQSNVLAVNAALEAAKADDRGKGFGVVADEIRSLASGSMEGVVQVRGALSDIAKATGDAVTAAEESSGAVEAGVAEMAELRDAIESLAESVSMSAHSAAQIEASAQQQLVGMDQIGEAMTSIDQASDQNAAGAGQLEAEIGHLQDLARRLSRLITSDEADDAAQSAVDRPPAADETAGSGATGIRGATRRLYTSARRLVRR